MATLHLICGLPGSGKSTLAQQLEAQGCGVRFTPDEWMLDLGFSLYDESQRARVESLQWKLAQKLLSQGTSVILENGFWSKAERIEYRATAVRLGADTRLHYLHVPLEELKARVERRNASLPHAERVRTEDLDAWSRTFEAPDHDEL